MKFGIISDIHGCYEGLVSALEHLISLNCKVLCLGDIVSENSDENEKCIQTLKNLNIRTVQGQHDDTCVKCNFPPVSIQSRNFLASLPVMLKYRNILLVHDNPLENARNGEGMWHQGSYIRSEMDAKAIFEDFKPLQHDIKYVVVGHTHAPKIFSNKSKINIVFNKPIQLENNAEYIINPGSIGGIPRGEQQVHSYVLFDTDLNQITYYRVNQIEFSDLI